MEMGRKDGIEREVTEFKISVADIEECIPISPRKHRRQRLVLGLRRVFDFRNKSEQSPWPRLIRKLLLLFSAALLLGIFAVV